MTIAILKREPGQNIPRPLNRASSASEAIEILEHFAESRFSDTITIDTSKIDTEEPIARLPNRGRGMIEFFAFTE